MNPRIRVKSHEIPITKR